MELNLFILSRLGRKLLAEGRNIENAYMILGLLFWIVMEGWIDRDKVIKYSF